MELYFRYRLKGSIYYQSGKLVTEEVSTDVLTLTQLCKHSIQKETKTRVLTLYLEDKSIEKYKLNG